MPVFIHQQANAFCHQCVDRCKQHAADTGFCHIGVVIVLKPVGKHPRFVVLQQFKLIRQRVTSFNTSVPLFVLFGIFGTASPRHFLFIHMIQKMKHFPHPWLSFKLFPCQVSNCTEQTAGAVLPVWFFCGNGFGTAHDASAQSHQIAVVFNVKYGIITIFRFFRMHKV